MAETMLVMKVVLLIIYPFALALFTRRYDNKVPYFFLLLLFLASSTFVKAFIVCVFSIWAIYAWAAAQTHPQCISDNGGEQPDREPCLPSWKECLGATEARPEKKGRSR